MIALLAYDGLVRAKPAHSSSESIDDYLKAILELGGAEDSQVTTRRLAERLDVRTPSVTGMLQKLAAQRAPLVLYEKHRGVRLTAAGKRRAWELVRHHRLLELFLHDVLKYSCRLLRSTLRSAVLLLQNPYLLSVLNPCLCDYLY